MSIGKNIAKLTIPFFLLNGCSIGINETYQYHSKINEEEIDCVGMKGFVLFLSVKKENGAIIEYCDFFEDKKLDYIQIDNNGDRYFISKTGVINITKENKEDIVGDGKTGEKILKFRQIEYTNYLNQILEKKKQRDEEIQEIYQKLCKKN